MQGLNPTVDHEFFTENPLGDHSGSLYMMHMDQERGFSTFTFEYENESENGKAGHENERELTKYRENFENKPIQTKLC
jgi:hypothetical protein